MQTPLPAQIEHWMKIVHNKKSHPNLKDDAMLHLSTIRDIINETLTKGKMRYENLPSRGYTPRREKRL
jgi:hypothetical protein